MPFVVPDLTEPLNALYLTGFILYSLTLIVAVATALRHLFQNRHRQLKVLKRCTVSGIFYVLVGLFLSCRVAWAAIELFWGDARQYLQFALNVVADCLFFSCFSLIVMHWADVNSKTTVGESKNMFSSVMGWVFLAINLVLYAFQLGVITYIIVRDDDNSALVLTSILVAVLENCVVGVGFLIFGLRLYCNIQSTISSVADPATLGQQSSVRKTLIVTIIMTACFLSRSVLYVVDVVTKKDDNADDLITIDSIPRLVLIYISELAPILYQLWLQRAKKKKEEIHDQFIQDLYEQNEIVSSDTLETESLLDSETRFETVSSKSAHHLIN